MRKYRAEQIMRWLDIRDKWRLSNGNRKILKSLFKKRGELIDMKRRMDNVLGIDCKR